MVKHGGKLHFVFFYDIRDQSPMLNALPIMRLRSWTAAEWMMDLGLYFFVRGSKYKLCPDQAIFLLDGADAVNMLQCFFGLWKKIAILINVLSGKWYKAGYVSYLPALSFPSRRSTGWCREMVHRYQGMNSLFPLHFSQKQGLSPSTSQAFEVSSGSHAQISSVSSSLW